MPSVDPNCTLCGLHATCNTVGVAAEVGARPPLDVLFVGEAPGAEEDAKGRPFIGQSGRLLRQAIEVFGIDKYKYGITNAVKCRPPENRQPSIREVRSCNLHLEAEIEQYKPRYLVPLGNVALRALTDKTGVTKYVGRTMPHPSGAQVFPMLHPSAVLRAEGVHGPMFEAGFEMLARTLKGEASHTRDFPRLAIEDVPAALGRLARRKATFAIDIETGPARGHEAYEPASLNPKFGRIVSCAVAWLGGGNGDKPEVFWFPWPTGAEEVAGVRVALASLLLAGGVMVAHNAVFETKWFLHHVIRPTRKAPGEYRKVSWRVDDTLLFHHLIDENQPHGLDVVAAQYTDMGGYDNEVALLLAEGKRHHELPIDVLGRYNAGDALATLKVWQVLRPKVFEDEGLKKTWLTVTRPSIFSVAWAELRGRKVDFTRVERLRAKWTAEADENRATLVDSPEFAKYVEQRKAAGNPLKGGEVNPASPAQMADILFKIAKVPVVGETDGGAPSVKDEYIRPYADRFPILATYLKWKGADTSLTKFLAPVETLVAPDSFLYGSYLIHGTVTGRFASSKPNLQNFSAEARDIVVSRFSDGYIVEADYSQLELRLMAEASHCVALLEAYRAGLDVHVLTASKVCSLLQKREVTIEEVVEQHEKATAEHGFSWRQNLGKVPNFGCIYGARPKRLHLTFGLSMQDAEAMYEAFHAAYPEIGRFLRDTHRLVQQTGALRSRLGRLRRLPEARGSDPHGVMMALLQASNFPVQSLGSDLNTWAFNRTCALLAERGMETVGLGPTHDSGAYDAPASEVPALVEMLRPVMLTEAVAAVCPDLNVPLDIAIKAGRTWGSVKDYKPGGAEPRRGR